MAQSEPKDNSGRLLRWLLVLLVLGILTGLVRCQVQVQPEPEATSRSAVQMRAAA